MPIYEYECHKCNKQFEELVFSNSDPVHCPQCQSSDVEKFLSKFAFKSGSTFRSTGSCASGCGSCSGGHCGSCHG